MSPHDPRAAAPGAPGAPDLRPLWRRSEVRAAGGWLQARQTEFGERVAGSLVPVGYEAYVRLPHPVEDVDEREVTWGAVAAWTGRTLHATAQWEQLSRPAPGHVPEGPRPWDESEEPYEGMLSDRQLAALVPLLAAHTTTPDSCFFALWDGYGFLGDARECRSSIAVSVITDGDASPEEIAALRAEALPGPGLDVSQAPRMALPHREYVLLEGPVRAAPQVGIGLGRPYANDAREGPHLWWPSDRAWVVATDTDLTSTYVACSAGLARALCGGGAVEALAVAARDRFGEDADTVNR